MNRWKFAIVYAILCVLGTPAFSDSLWRTVYDEDQYLKELGKVRLEKAYGTPLETIPWNEKTPFPKDRPVIRRGFFVLHTDLDDDWEQKWVMGLPGKNPGVDFLALKTKLLSQFPDLKNMSDKWDEWRFLTRLFPDISPPEMQLASEFFEDKADAPQERARIEKAVEKTMADKGLESKEVKSDLVQLELVRLRIEKRLGKSVLKNRLLNHSEGKFPKSDKNWIELFADYIKSGTQRKIHKIQDEIAKDKPLNFAEEILELPHVEGFILETMLQTPEAIIVQKWTKKHREVRMHIVRGQILRDATFLRFYEINEYLPQNEKQTIEDAFERDFLAKLDALGPDVRENFYCTPDVILEDTGGPPKVRILDFNDGLDSGYYFPEEDLFTTSYLAQAFSGEPTPFLQEFDEFKSAPREDKLKLLKTLLKENRPFMQGDVLQAFWDRVVAHYKELIAGAVGADAKGEMLLTALETFKATKLEDPGIYLQLTTEMYDTYPDIHIPREQLRDWRRDLNVMSPDVRVQLVENETRLVGAYLEESRSKRELQRMRASLRQRMKSKKLKVRHKN